MPCSNTQHWKVLSKEGYQWDPLTETAHHPSLWAPKSVKPHTGRVIRFSCCGSDKGASYGLVALPVNTAAAFVCTPAPGSMMRLSLHPDVVPNAQDGLPPGYLKFAVLHAPRHWATLFKISGQDLRLVVKTTQGFPELALVHRDHLRADGSVVPPEPLVDEATGVVTALKKDCVAPSRLALAMARVAVPRVPYAAHPVNPSVLATLSPPEFTGAERTPHCDWHFAEGVGFNDTVAELQAFLQAHAPQ